MRFLMALVGFAAGSIAGMIIALVFGESLFGWHDNIGPEARFALFSGLFGSIAAYIRQSNREHRKHAVRRSERS